MLPPGITVLSDGTIIGRRGKPLKGTPSSNGYLTFTAWMDGKSVTFAVHRVVCEAFHGPRPSPKHQARHLNGVNTDNRASNLAWGTSKENHADRTLHGTDPIGIRNPVAKLTWDQVREVRRRHASESTPVTLLATDYGVDPSTLTDVLDGKTWVDPSYSPLVDADTRRGTKLKAQQVLEIRARYATSEVPFTELAKEYGVSRQQISQIIRRKSWAHI